MRVDIVESNDLYDSMFQKQGYTLHDDSFTPLNPWESIDLICFTGGKDVSPDLYGQKNVSSNTNRDRDEKECFIWQSAKRYNIPCVGICRGAQFLNVMNGGSLWQDVDGHNLSMQGLHEISGNLKVTSTHHQQMRCSRTKRTTILATSQLGSYKTNAGGVCDVTDLNLEHALDYEVLAYQDTKDLCFQGHPEYPSSPKETTDWFFQMIDQYCLTNRRTDCLTTKYLVPFSLR